MRKTLLVAAGFVALRENGDNDGCGYYYDGKDDNFFINLGVGIHYFMEPASFASGEFFDWMVNAAARNIQHSVLPHLGANKKML